MKFRQWSGTRSPDLGLLSHTASSFTPGKMTTGNLNPIYLFGPQAKRKRSSFPSVHLSVTQKSSRRHWAAPHF